MWSCTGLCVYLHRGDGGGRTGISGEGREGGLSALFMRTISEGDLAKHKGDTYGLLYIGVALASGEVGGDAGRERRRLGDDIGAVDERALVNTEETETTEDVGEGLDELLLVVRERLPLAGGARVTSEQVVGLETHLTAERRGDFTLNTPIDARRPNWASWLLWPAVWSLDVASGF